MGNTNSGNGRCTQYLGGAISGIGIGIILPAALEQFTNRTLENYSRLILGLGLFALVVGFALARRAGPKSE